VPQEHAIPRVQSFLGSADTHGSLNETDTLGFLWGDYECRFDMNTRTGRPAFNVPYTQRYFERARILMQVGGHQDLAWFMALYRDQRCSRGADRHYPGLTQFPMPRFRRTRRIVRRIRTRDLLALVTSTSMTKLASDHAADARSQPATYVVLEHRELRANE
jgi:hypothetical protein